MEVKMLIRSVVIGTTKAGKQKAEVTAETEKPLQILQFNLFEAAFTDGTVEQFKKAVNTKQLVPLEVDTYNGRIQFGFPYGTEFKAEQQTPAK